MGMIEKHRNTPANTPHVAIQQDMPDFTRRRVTSSKRFPSDYTAFSQKFNVLSSTLRSFINFRSTARPDEPYNSKDSKLRSALNCRRCHLINGKAILLYRIEGSELQMLAIVEHDEIEYRTEDLLSSAIGRADFAPYEQPDLPAARSVIPQQLRRPIPRRETGDQFDMAGFIKARNLAPEVPVSRTPQGRQFVSDADMYPVGSDVSLAGDVAGEVKVVPLVRAEEFVSEREVWRDLIVRMRLEDHTWDMIRTMRNRLKDDPVFRKQTFDSYVRSTPEELGKRRLYLRTKEKRRIERIEAEARDARSYGDGLKALSADAIAQQIERRMQSSREAADIAMQLTKLRGQYEAVSSQNAALEASLRAERGTVAEMRRLAEVAQQALVEARTAKNLAAMGRDQAEEALQAEKTLSRAHLVRLREIEAVATERTVRLSSVAKSTAPVAKALVTTAPDPKIQQLRDEQGVLRKNVRAAQDARKAAEHELADARKRIDDLNALLVEKHDAQAKPRTCGQRLLRLRLAAGLSMTAVSKGCGVKHDTYSHWERDITIPHGFKLAALADFFHKDIADIVPEVPALPAPVQKALPARRAAAPKPVAWWNKGSSHYAG